MTRMKGSVMDAAMTEVGGGGNVPLLRIARRRVPSKNVSRIQISNAKPCCWTSCAWVADVPGNVISKISNIALVGDKRLFRTLLGSSHAHRM